MIDRDREDGVIERAGTGGDKRAGHCRRDIARANARSHLGAKGIAAGQGRRQGNRRHVAGVGWRAGNGGKFLGADRIGDRVLVGNTDEIASTKEIEGRAFGCYLDRCRTGVGAELQDASAVEPFRAGKTGLRVGERAGKQEDAILGRGARLNEELRGDGQQVVGVGELDEYLAVAGAARCPLGLRHVRKDVVFDAVRGLHARQASAVGRTVGEGLARYHLISEGRMGIGGFL